MVYYYALILHLLKISLHSLVEGKNMDRTSIMDGVFCNHSQKDSGKCVTVLDCIHIYQKMVYITNPFIYCILENGQISHCTLCSECAPRFCLNSLHFRTGCYLSWFFTSFGQRNTVFFSKTYRLAQGSFRSLRHFIPDIACHLITSFICP